MESETGTSKRPSMIAVERGQRDDLPAVLKLLQESGLPLDGVSSDMPLIVARHDGRVIGVAALEIYSDGALLRSVAVDPVFRGSGVGHRITAAALQAAEAARVAAVFLLTTTAESYFTRFGFERIDRSEVPEGVRQSVEFVSACPASAVAMRRRPPASATQDAVTTVLFACVHNAGRSQMAAAFFNLLADPAKARAVSAGTNPGPSVHPEVVDAMREAGIDLTNATTQRLSAELASSAAYLITMGCGDECPIVPGAKRDDWPLPDPKGQPVEQVRAIRDEIRRRVEALLVQEGFW